MMGIAQWDPNSPVAKGTSAILVFSEAAAKVYDQPPVCIHCGKCVEACQMRLMPTKLAMFSAAGRYDLCEEYDAMSCVECGACTYICPGRLPITQYIRAAKAKITEQRKTRAAALEASKAQKPEAAPNPVTSPKAEAPKPETESEKTRKRTRRTGNAERRR